MKAKYIVKSSFVKYFLLGVITICVVVFPVSSRSGNNSKAKKASPVLVTEIKNEVSDSKSVHSLDAATRASNTSRTAKATRTFYGQASYYANKFNGRKTANGDIFSQDKLTCACNILPLGTLVRVTNLRNGKSVIVKTNDRIHPRMKRVVDMSKAAAAKLGYVNRGLTRVKVEPIVD